VVKSKRAENETEMTTIDFTLPLARAGLLSEAAANVSWQFMLLKDEPSDRLERLAHTEATRVCTALEEAEKVVTTSAETERGQQLGQATTRRLIEDRQKMQPILTRILEFLPSIRDTLEAQKLTREQAQFLQGEFAALSLVLQDRGF